MAAHNAGFNAVECHWPYDCDPQQLKAVLDQTGLPMLGLNTRRGDLSALTRAKQLTKRFRRIYVMQPKKLNC